MPSLSGVKNIICKWTAKSPAELFKEITQPHKL